MNFNEYQQGALSTAVYPEGAALVYLPLKLAGEAGEVAEKLGKAVRNGDLIVGSSYVYFKDADTAQALGLELAKEIGDVLWYLAVLSFALGFDFNTIAHMNADKLQSRSIRGLLIGEGDNR